MSKFLLVAAIGAGAVACISIGGGIEAARQNYSVATTPAPTVTTTTNITPPACLDALDKADIHINNVVDVVDLLASPERLQSIVDDGVASEFNTQVDAARQAALTSAREWHAAETACKEAS